MNNSVIGIDIGGTNTTIGLVDPNGIVFATKNISTQEYSEEKPYLDDISTTIETLLSENSIENFDGIGIGAPNASFKTGCIEENTANLKIKTRIQICDYLHNMFNTKVVVSNDADAAAFGEYIYGGAKNCDNFIMVTLGTGVGSGFFVDGHLAHGVDCMAGELGHFIINPFNGRLCSCGRSGCVETYASARGICQTFRELAEKEHKLYPNLDLSNITSKQIGDLAHQNDEIALKTFDVTAYWLSLSLANAATFSAPEKIFLMGGPTRVGAPLVEPLKRYFDQHILYIYKGKIKIELSSLNANEAAILGAAALIYSK